MKRLNLILIAILAAMLIFCVVFHNSGKLQAEVAGVAASASDHIDTFNSVVDILRDGVAPQTFVPEVPTSPDGMFLVATTVTLKNNGFCDANWIEVQAIGASGDIAVYALEGTGMDIPKGQSGDLILKFITTTPGEKRRLKISYYIMGVPRTITVNI